jgi:hypothetical protein
VSNTIKCIKTWHLFCFISPVRCSVRILLYAYPHHHLPIPLYFGALPFLPILFGIFFVNLVPKFLVRMFKFTNLPKNSDKPYKHENYHKNLGGGEGGGAPQHAHWRKSRVGSSWHAKICLHVELYCTPSGPFYSAY